MMDLRSTLPITHHRDQAKLDISGMEKIQPADSKVVARIPLRNGFLAHVTGVFHVVCFPIENPSK